MLNAMRDGLGLGDAYAATLERIRIQGGAKAKLAMATLMWVCHSERPLRVEELCHALAVEIGSAHFNSDNIPAAETLLTCGQGLVVIDKEASTFRLVHHTLSEYLSVHHNLFPRAHSTMADTCLTYLDSTQARALPAEPQPDLSSLPFLKYCSRYWGTHTRREISDRTILLAVELLDQYENHVAANALFEEILNGSDTREVSAPSLFGGLHCASFFGIVDIMTRLLRVNGCDANQGDSAGITPLMWAVRGGHEGAVELLLGLKAVCPNKPDNNGCTPLLWSAFLGHESIAKQILDREDVHPNQPENRNGSTPLIFAAFRGHEAVVKQLLDRQDVDPDKPDNKGKTPLADAAVNGHESVVKQLLDRPDVDPDKQDNEGNTPLSWAAMKGHESVVKHLLDRQDVNPDKPDNEGSTPLSWAAIEGHESVVKRLLDRQDVDPDKPDNKGITPLSWAAMKGHESVVKQLLDLQDIDPARPYKRAKIPFSLPAANGNQEIVNPLSRR